VPHLPLTKKIFPEGPKVMKFYFSFSKQRKQPFFAENVIKNVKFQNPGGTSPLAPLPTSMSSCIFFAHYNLFVFIFKKLLLAVS